jgi:membrane-anchored glycerophosphoryl diester phosphodiesterase (GDPDase)
LILTIPLIIFSDVKAIDAIKYSFQLCQNSLILLALIVVAIVGQWSDLLAAVSGVFYTTLHVLDVLRDVQ